MNREIAFSRNWVYFGVPLVLLTAVILLINSSCFDGSNALSLAISIDLLVTVPIVYFLLIRKSTIPKTTVVPFVILGLVLGTSFLPKENQAYLELFRLWALPVLEVSILTYVIINVRKGIRAYKSQKETTLDFYDALRKTCGEILPKKLVLPFSTEVAVFYYGFFQWKRRELAENEYSYHKESGSPALLGALIFIIAVEAVAMHFLLELWSPIFAWVLTGLSAYTAIQVFGMAKSLGQRPFVIETNQLILRYGIMNEVKIPFDAIESVVTSNKDLEKDKLTKTLSPLGELESHNVVLQLKNENTLVGLYGLKKKFTTLGLYVDEPNRFVTELESKVK